MFKVVFWDILPCKIIIPEDNSEHHTRRRENLKSHIIPKQFILLASCGAKVTYSDFRLTLIKDLI
jgi:hypothetical protein